MAQGSCSRPLLFLATILLLICQEAVLGQISLNDTNSASCKQSCPNFPTTAIAPCSTDCDSSGCCLNVWWSPAANVSSPFDYCFSGASPTCVPPAFNRSNLTACQSCPGFPPNVFDGICIPGVNQNGTLQNVYAVLPSGLSFPSVGKCPAGGTSPPTGVPPPPGKGESDTFTRGVFQTMIIALLGNALIAL